MTESDNGRPIRFQPAKTAICRDHFNAKRHGRLPHRGADHKRVFLGMKVEIRIIDVAVCACRSPHNSRQKNGPVGFAHGVPDFGQHEPRGFISNSDQSMQREGGDSVIGAGHQKNGLEPFCQRRSAAAENRAGDQRGLVAAIPALEQGKAARLDSAAAAAGTSRARVSPRPFGGKQGKGASFFRLYRFRNMLDVRGRNEHAFHHQRERLFLLYQTHVLVSRLKSGVKSKKNPVHFSVHAAAGSLS
nr:hypothetical protein [Paenibacillus thermoaerophilus]